MGLRILGSNGGAWIAESTGPKPVCLYCDWARPEYFILAKRGTVELICGRHLKGSPTLRRCDLFLRATGSDDE
jgi:hypothetical protein